MIVFSSSSSALIVVLLYARTSAYITVRYRGRFSDLAPAATGWEVISILPHLALPQNWCLPVRDFNAFTEWKKFVILYVLRRATELVYKTILR